VSPARSRPCEPGSDLAVATTATHLMRRGSGLASGLLAGTALDAVLGDPRKAHPVAIFGSLAGRLERRLWADSRARGALFAAACIGPVAAAGWALQRLARAPESAIGVTAVTTWTVLGAASLGREALAVARALEADDLEAARERLPALCGRDPDQLDELDIARAVIESVAENTSDAVVAPLVWGAIAGIPGLLGYRAINTLDAMVGHRSLRYERFGWAAARVDDAANWAPARATALLAVALAPLAGGRAKHAMHVLRRDGAEHPSPNAGRCEAAFAGTLGVRLGGTNVYAGVVQRRGLLGDGRAARPADIGRAVRLSRLVTAAAAVSAAAGAQILRRRRP
jgi:adenosylcobinamide-phosphate synthase